MGAGEDLRGVTQEVPARDRADRSRRRAGRRSSRHRGPGASRRHRRRSSPRRRCRRRTCAADSAGRARSPAARATSWPARAAARRRTRSRPSADGASFATRLASLSNPALAMLTNACPSTSPRSSGQTSPAMHRRAGGDRVARNAERAREIVATAAGEDAHHGPRASAQRVGDGADQSVPAERHDRLAVIGCDEGQAPRILEVASCTPRARSCRRRRACPPRRRARDRRARPRRRD